MLWLRYGLCKEVRQGGHYKREKLDFYGRMEGMAVCKHCYGAPGVEGSRKDNEWWSRIWLRNLYLPELPPFIQ